MPSGMSLRVVVPLFIVHQHPHRGRLDVVVLTASNSPRERPHAEAGEQEGNWDEYEEDIHRRSDVRGATSEQSLSTWLPEPPSTVVRSTI